MLRLKTAVRGLAVIALAATVTGCSSDDVQTAAQTDTPTDAQSTTAPSPSPQALQVGDCVRFVQTGGPDGSSLDEVDCEYSHHAEVVLASDQFFAGDDQLPAENRIIKLADTACAEAMVSYSGVSAQEAGARMSYLYPTQETWAAGDRKLTCIAVAYDEAFDSIIEVLGSMRLYQ